MNRSTVHDSGGTGGLKGPSRACTDPSIECFGILSSPAFVRQPEGNGVAERAIRTLKEQLLWVRHFETVEELRQALAAFAAEHNASWLRQRHGYKTPDQIRAEQKALAPEAATGG